MGILRSDRVSGLGGANAINGSVFFGRNGVPATASGNWLTVQSDSDFSFGTGDFTIEAWIYYTGTTSSSNSGFFQLSNTPGGINNASNASDGGLAGDFEGGVIKGIGNGNWFNGTTSVTAKSWIHVAMVRHSGTLQWFVNGAADTSASDSNNYSLTHLAIGGYYTTSYLFSGYISNFRIVKGTAVYSSAFTPPTERLTAIDGTVLLACQSPGNIFQEATGKTLEIRKVNSNDAPPMASRFVPDKGEDHGTTLGDNTKFDTLSYMVPPGGTTTQRNRGRGVFAGGYTGPSGSGQTGTTTMEYFQIQSGGRSIDFGTLSEDRKFSAGLASATRGVVGGSDGTPSWSTGTMEYVTIATTSNTTTFGNMTAAGGMVSACSNNTRGIYFSVWDASGSGPTHKGHIDYITIATAGNAADFGELSVNRPEAAGFSSPTRGICAGGYPTADGTTMSNVIDYITIATTGNASDFGDLTQARQASSSASSQTRGVVAAGFVYGSPASTYTINTIDYVTIASTGNATDFGDLVAGATAKSVGNCSNQIRGVFAGGKTSSPTYINTVEFINIAVTGNASDFGDLTRTPAYGSVFSDSHGGIS